MILAFIGTCLVLIGLFMFYLCYHFILVPEDEYKTYRKGLPSFIKTLIGENVINREGQVNGDSRSNNDGKLKDKSSYSPEHTKRLFKL